MPFEIIDKSYLDLPVDALVVFANPMLQVETNLSNKVFQSAGSEKVKEACLKLAPVPLGEAVATLGFSLSAKHIIHTASPHYYDGKSGEAAVLSASYLNSLKLVSKLECQSVAFPLLSTGSFSFPIEESFRIGSEVIKAYLEENELTVYLSLFDRKVVAPTRRFGDPQERAFYERLERFDREFDAAIGMPILSEANYDYKQGPPAPLARIESNRPSTSTDLRNYLGNRDETFQQTLLKLIDASGKTDPQVYRKANLTRQHFAKIRGNIQYAPTKPTVLALAIALELDVVQTRDLLARAGFALSRSIKFDLIVEYFLKRKRYDIYRINEMLFYYDQPLLGSQVRE